MSKKGATFMTDINRDVPSTEIKLRGKGSKPGRAKFANMRFTPSGTSDQSMFADTPEGKQAANELEKMRVKYQRLSIASDAKSIRPLSEEQKQIIYILKHNIKEKEMQGAFENFAEAEKDHIRTIQEHASA